VNGEIWMFAGGAEIMAEDLLMEIKLRPGDALVSDLIFRKVAAALARKKGIQVAAEEVEEALGEFYAEQDLMEEEQVLAWRKARMIDEDALRGRLREERLRNRLREALVPDAAVEDRFRSNPYEYATAEVEVFVHPYAGVAKEFLLSVQEGEREAGVGERRRLTRAQAPEEVAALLFSAEPGALVGPAETEDETYEVYRLIRRDEAALGDDLREEIREELFREAVRAALAREPLRFQR